MRAVLWVSLVGCTGETSTDVAALEVRVEELEADRDDLETDLADALARVAVLEASVAGQDGRFDAVESDVAELQDGWITTSETWTVGSTGTYATLEAAWNAVLGRRLTPEASVTLSLQDGPHTLAGELSLNHPDGERISIQGSSQASVTVTSPEDGFVVEQGHRFGRISGITLQGTDNQGNGLLVEEGAQVEIADVTFANFLVGVKVFGGHVTSLGTVTATDASIGVDLSAGATWYGEDFDMHGVDAGVIAQESQFHASSLAVSDSLSAALSVSVGGVAFIGDLDVTTTPAGVLAHKGGVFVAGQGTYAGGAGYALYVAEGGFADLGVATISNKTTGVSVSSHGTADLSGVTFQTVTTPVINATAGVVIGP